MDLGRGGLVAGADDDLVDVDVRRLGDGPADALGDVLGAQRLHPLVDAPAASSSPSKRTSENSVSTMPGAISVTRTGSPSSSSRRLRSIERWACLAAM